MCKNVYLSNVLELKEVTGVTQYFVSLYTQSHSQCLCIKRGDMF